MNCGRAGLDLDTNEHCEVCRIAFHKKIEQCTLCGTGTSLGGFVCDGCAKESIRPPERVTERRILLLDAAIRAKDMQMSVMNDEIEWLRRVVERSLPVGKGPSDASSP